MKLIYKLGAIGALCTAFFAGGVRYKNEAEHVAGVTKDYTVSVAKDTGKYVSNITEVVKKESRRYANDVAADTSKAAENLNKNNELEKIVNDYNTVKEKTRQGFEKTKEYTVDAKEFWEKTAENAAESTKKGFQKFTDWSVNFEKKTRGYAVELEEKVAKKTREYAYKSIETVGDACVLIDYVLIKTAEKAEDYAPETVDKAIRWFARIRSGKNDKGLDQEAEIFKKKTEQKWDDLKEKYSGKDKK